MSKKTRLIVVCLLVVGCADPIPPGQGDSPADFTPQPTADAAHKSSEPAVSSAFRPPTKRLPIFYANGMADYARQVQSLTASGELGWILIPQPGPAASAQLDSATSQMLPADWASGQSSIETCAECHEDFVDGFRKTAHFRTSYDTQTTRPLGRFHNETIAPDAVGNDADFATAHPQLSFRMSAVDEAYVMTASLSQDGGAVNLPAKMDIAVGSGNHGQSFLSWLGDGLYMLPLTYFTATDSWVNSPGYVDGTANFARPVTPRCLECHSTYFASKDVLDRHSYRYVRESAMLGITCVRCHGDPDEHVTYHRRNPDASEAHQIVHPGKLDRLASIGVCAQCHSGVGDPVQPSFSYVPGKDLATHINLDTSESSHAAGVHTANQYARLKQSKCFESSETMTCATCHDPHNHEHGQEQQFSQRCTSCHAPDKCPPAALNSVELSHRCVSCHMREEDSADISVTSGGKRRTPKMHDHLIRIWPEHSRQLLEQWQVVDQQ